MESILKQKKKILIFLAVFWTLNVNGGTFLENQPENTYIFKGFYLKCQAGGYKFPIGQKSRANFLKAFKLLNTKYKNQAWELFYIEELRHKDTFACHLGQKGFAPHVMSPISFLDFEKITKYENLL